METTFSDLGYPFTTRPLDFGTRVDVFVEEVVQSIGADMQRQPASMVYELIRESVARRLPGIEVDQEPLRQAAARISAGVPV